MSNRRQQQVAEFIREEVSDIMRNEMNDPRLGFASVTQVDMSPDLRYAKVFISVLGEDEERDATIEALSGASGFIRNLLKPRMRTRHIPYLTFVSDRSLEHAESMARTLNQIRAEDAARETEETVIDESGEERGGSSSDRN